MTNTNCTNSTNTTNDNTTGLFVKFVKFAFRVSILNKKTPHQRGSIARASFSALMATSIWSSDGSRVVSR